MSAAPSSSSHPLHRIVIVGGGAGGLPLATALGDQLGRRGKAEITLVDRCETHVWKPLLHEIAAGRMDADVHGIAYMALAHWHRFRFRQGSVAGLDRARHELALNALCDSDGSEILPPRTIPYDTLLFCVGSVSNDYGVPGVAEHAIALDTEAEAEHFHRKLIAACVRADGQAAQGKPARVNIVIIGAGATGVELAAEIRQTTRTHAGYGLEYIDPLRDVRITIIEAAPRILPQLPERISSAAADLLAKLAIDMVVDEPVSAVTGDGVQVKSGTIFPAELIVWAAGIRAPTWLDDLDGLEVNRAHQLVVDATLRATRDADIFAFGDCAACPWPEANKPDAILPPRGQVAYQQAKMLMKTMRARLAGQSVPEFHFHDFGSLISLGELSAVGNLMGRLIGGSLLVQGLIARWMYASLYKRHQISLHGYIRVALDTVGHFMRRRLTPRVKLH